MRNDIYVEYSLHWSPHVKGRYTERTVDEDGIPEEQKVEAFCQVCNTMFRRTCSSGMVRQHIAMFAQVHVHRNPLSDPFPGAKT